MSVGKLQPGPIHDMLLKLVLSEICACKLLLEPYSILRCVNSVLQLVLVSCIAALLTGSVVLYLARWCISASLGGTLDQVKQLDAFACTLVNG